MTTPHAGEIELPNPNPTDAQLVAYARWVLRKHKVKHSAAGQLPQCSCGHALSTCEYVGQATFMFGAAPLPPPPPVSA